MQCEFYKARPDELIDWCCGPEQLQRYQGHLTAECERMADISLLRHLKQLLQVLQQLQVNGYAFVLEQQRGALDALFTDMLALATWLEWDAPAESLGEGELPLDIEQRGLLGADESVNTAMLFVVDAGTIALTRGRIADTDARHPHERNPD